MEIGNFEIENSAYEKLLGVHFGIRLTIGYHISGLYEKASTKISAVARVSRYMNLSKRNLNEYFV